MIIGYAVCGSFCTHSKVIPTVEKLINLGYEIQPIMSEITYVTDTRFGKAADLIDKLENLCERKIIHTVKEAEPIGPKKLLDALIIAPCTGNTLGKIAGGITDSCVTMSAKAHLRNEKPLILALATNDALGASAENFGRLLNVKNVYFAPLGQDDPKNKPKSMIAHFELIPETLAAALEARQLQPILG